MRQPMYDLASVFAGQVMRAGEEAGKVYEPVIGLVTDNKDPKKLGRVKVKIPVLSKDDTTYWCPIIMLGAGKNRGWFFIPEKDDEVLLMFEHGDMDHPLVVGALWNGKDKPPDGNPAPYKNDHRVFKSRAGSVVMFNDGGEQRKIEIRDGTGKGVIELHTAKKKIIIEALEGDVCFQTPEGEMKIVAKEVELKATDNLEVNAGGAMAWGTDSQVKIHAPNVVMSGDKVHFNCGKSSAPATPTANPVDTPDPYGG